MFAMKLDSSSSYSKLAFGTVTKDCSSWRMGNSMSLLVCCMTWLHMVLQISCWIGGITSSWAPLILALSGTSGVCQWLVLHLVLGCFQTERQGRHQLVGLLLDLRADWGPGWHPKPWLPFWQTELSGSLEFLNWEILQALLHLWRWTAVLLSLPTVVESFQCLLYRFWGSCYWRCNEIVEIQTQSWGWEWAKHWWRAAWNDQDRSQHRSVHPIWGCFCQKQGLNQQESRPGTQIHVCS